MAASFFGSLLSAWRRQLPKARPRKQRAHALGGAVETIGQDPLDPVGRLLLRRRALKLSIGLGQGSRTGVLGVAQMPDDPSADNRGQIHLVGETVAVLLVGQEIGGSGETTPGQHGHQAVLAQRTDQTIESHGREMADDRTQL